MSYRRYQTEFPFWKSPYYNSGYRRSVTDLKMMSHESKAFVNYRRDYIQSATKSKSNKQYENTKNDRQQNSNLSLRESRLKREITQELHNQLPGSIKIWIPIRTTSALPNKKKSTKTDNQQNEQINELKNHMEEMKAKIEQQDELIQDLRQQLKNKKTRPPSIPSLQVTQSVTPTMPYVEDPPTIELIQTIWE